MKYLVASLFAALQLLSFILLAGAGHGWIAGAFSCLPLAPISFAAWFNALRAEPSLSISNYLLVAAGLVLAERDRKARAFSLRIGGCKVL
jgi:hypothetical protein